MIKKTEDHPSAGVKAKPTTKSDKAKGVEIVKSGHRDKRFGLQKKLGKDGCGY